VADVRDRPLGVIVCADETMAVVASDLTEDVRRELADRVAVLDADAVVLDVSDGWRAVALIGDDADRALSYLSALEPPAADGFAQGDVARVAAKILREPDGLLILVPAYWHEYIRARAAEDVPAAEARS
jgi:hypothetical protein